MHHFARYLSLFVAVLALWFAVRKDSGSSSASLSKEKEPPAAATHTVAKEPFKIEISLDGVVEATEMSELACHTENWKELSLLDVVEHGRQVKKNDIVATFNPTKIEESIRDLENGRALSEVAFKQTQQEIAALERSMPVEIASAERASKFAVTDLKQFLEQERDLETQKIDLEVTEFTNFLAYAKEELRQLEKMYKADDLTEETEEMILRRQRNEVALLTRLVDLFKMERDKTVSFKLPRDEEKFRAAVEKETVALEKAKATLPVQLEKLKLDAEKQKFDLTKSAEKLAQLRQDKDAMTIRAPVDGTVYYGDCLRGQWTTASAVTPRMQRGGIFQPHEVLMTIVRSQPTFVRAVVPEKNMEYIKPDVSGQAILASQSDQKQPVTIESVLTIPVAAGKFDARLRLERADALALVPGSACTLKFTPYTTAEALTVPAATVFTDELDSDKHYVYLPGEGAKPEKRVVKLGHHTETTDEIIEGLKEGDKVLLKKPEG